MISNSMACTSPSITSAKSKPAIMIKRMVCRILNELILSNSHIIFIEDFDVQILYFDNLKSMANGKEFISSLQSISKYYNQLMNKEHNA